MPLGSGAATNDLSGLLQKGLFEEEANRNLEAAAQAYSAVSAQFDKDRKLAATAIFRLGEIYRKQGKTNEAAGQYERIIREFADQDTLVTLSRQNLSALGNRTEEKSNRPDNFQRQYLEQQSTVAEMEALLAQLKKLDRQELRRVLPKVAPDPLLSSLLDEISKAVPSYATVLKIRGEADPTTKEQGTKLNQLEQQVNERVDEVMAGLERRLTAARNQLDWLKSQTQPGRPGGGSEPISKAARLEQKRLLEEEIKLTEQDLAEIKKQVANGVAPPSAPRDKEREILKLQRQLAALDVAGETTAGQDAPADDDEEKEIRRLQAMIQNSPDLINGTAGVTGPLSTAASRGQLRVATFLLDNGADVNAGTPGQTPLQNAVQSGNKAMAELLLQRGADVNAKDGTGGTPLHLAAQNGFLSIAEVLLKYKADLNARDSKANGEQSPLHLAAKNGNAALVGFLLANGDNANRRDARGRTPLHLAAMLDRDSVIEQLLKSGADVNATDMTGGTPLMNAALAGQSDSVKALLAAKAKPDLLDTKGRTALSYAAEYGHLDSVRALLAAKADPNLGQKDLPLASAVKAGQLEIAETLLRGAANPNLAGKFSREVRAPGIGGLDTYGTFGPYLPLQIALADGNAAMIKLLLKYQADANTTDPWTQPPKSLLFYTLAPKDVDLLKAFLDAGANPNVVDAEGQSPLMRTTFPQSNEMAALLAAAGADIKYANRDGWTALHLAVAYQNKDLTALLLSKGADSNQRMKDGQTPLDLAKPAAAKPAVANPKLSEEIAALLRQHGALDDLPNLDRIEVRRPSAKFSAIAFQMGTNGWNEFNLLELIALHYGLISTERNAVWEVNKWAMSSFWQTAACQFPDLSHVVIRRPASVGAQRTEMEVNVAELLDSGNCARDVKLKPGDIIEIPEADHPVNEQWAGIGGPQLSNLLHCISRTVTISIKGTPTTIRLAPGFKPTGLYVLPGVTMQELTRGSFMLKSVLAQSRLLRASSDLSRVKVTRRAGADGKSREWVLNCTGGNDPDLWLRDGDVIEVPDKP